MSATSSLVHSLCVEITKCRELQHIVRLLQAGIDVLLDFDAEKIRGGIISDSPDVMESQLAFIDQICDQQWTQQDIRSALYSRSFIELSDVLLTGMCMLAC